MTAKQSDVLVLGNGIMGAIIARKLSDAGLDVSIIEASGPCAGSSGRCDGDVLSQTKMSKFSIELTGWCVAAYKEMESELETDLKFDQNGSLMFVTDPEHVAPNAARVTELATVGIHAEALDGDECRELEPALGSAVQGGVFCPTDGAIYPPAVVSANTKRARSNGVRFVFGEQATSVIFERGRVAGVRTDRGIHRAPVVVNALGVWAPQLEVAGFPHLPIRPRQGILVVTERFSPGVSVNLLEAAYVTNKKSDDFTDVPSFAFLAEPTMDGNMLLGSMRRFAGFDLQVEVSWVAEIIRRANMILPGVQDVSIIRSFAGLRPWTPDHKPFVGESPEQAGYYVAAGHEGDGIALAPATAEIITSQILGRSSDTVIAQAAREFGLERLFTQEGEDRE
ncbi:NAD(P)/FAD-dependent oxidoreductase [Leucobacter sp. BZR 635]